MTDKVTGLVPFVHVADLKASIAFYEMLGLTVDETHEHNGRTTWVWLSNGDANLMLALASDPIEHERQGVFFYAYTDDLAALRARLVDAGWEPGEIRDGTPGPRRELPLCDPDRYQVVIAENEN
ncbi:glyoxalase/bleomycin resistance protein/dioxygenase superfamily protein [Herbihabitans rhizosphaerae]|uniref:Glyoxalase/bleomycin resistance protein/dioxygenase superfamily protein n=1 Tax=Herbihabitans rhizosphaerae TaxID=1872711 RepID=A0A4Q7KRT4_9PSEU|nr:VOC family protein [Herbihabitans rhizosphaerae]RZS38800.1 glyoxalase/bleomycin resistance protein/dioxygenase superfamily protein [Herbihabitans rhizosphaerae]